MEGLQVAVLLAVLCCSGACLSLQIKELRVPQFVRNGTEATLVLDCDYSVSDPKHWDGLVVKWYFNNDPAPVYQWIKEEKPQGFGILKNRLNLEYEASSESEKRHRAMQILNPTTELSGEYKCVVSTFANETSDSKKMVIYVPPEKNLKVEHTKHRDSGVNVTCAAEGVYPKPSLVIYNDRKEAGDLKVLAVPRNGVYDVLAWTMAEDNSPTTFHCELRIPETNYTLMVSAEYIPDVPSTTTTTDSPDTTAESSASSSSSDPSTGEGYEREADGCGPFAIFRPLNLMEKRDGAAEASEIFVE